MDRICRTIMIETRWQAVKGLRAIVMHATAPAPAG